MTIDEPQLMNIDMPGGSVIERVIRERLEKQVPLAAIYIDLIHLEPYCQQYGWVAGGRLIEMLAHVIRAALDSTGKAEDVCGHIFADEFVIVTAPDRAELLAQEIIQRFDSLVPQYYGEADRQRGYFEMVDRRGNPYRAFLAGVAIAIVTNAYRKLEHSLQMEELAAEVRGYIKTVPGSRYAFDRRQK